MLGWKLINVNKCSRSLAKHSVANISIKIGRIFSNLRDKTIPRGQFGWCEFEKTSVLLSHVSVTTVWQNMDQVTLFQIQYEALICVQVNVFAFELSGHNIQILVFLVVNVIASDNWHFTNLEGYKSN